MKNAHTNDGMSKNPHFGRVYPVITCTIWQVGRLSLLSLLPTSVFSQSWDGRSAIHQRSGASLEKNVGLSGHITHQAGKRIILRPLLR